MIISKWILYKKICSITVVGLNNSEVKKRTTLLLKDSAHDAIKRLQIYYLMEFIFSFILASSEAAHIDPFF